MVSKNPWTTTAPAHIPGGHIWFLTVYSMSTHSAKIELSHGAMANMTAENLRARLSMCKVMVAQKVILVQCSVARRVQLGHLLPSKAMSILTWFHANPGKSQPIHQVLSRDKDEMFLWLLSLSKYRHICFKISTLKGGSFPIWYMPQ